MTYTPGTLTDANPAATLYTNTIAPMLTANSYVLTDTVVISTRTHKVWQNPAGNNPTGKTWYLDVAYTTTGAGKIWLSTFEDFNPSTDLAFRGPWNAWAQAYTPDATYYSKTGATGYALESTQFHPNVAASNAVGQDVNIDCPVTSFGYWISVTPARIAAMHSGLTTAMTYVGAYTPSASHAAAAGADVFPLFTGRIGTEADGSNNNRGGLTRIPKFASSTGSAVNPMVYQALNVSAASPRMPSGTGGRGTVFATSDITRIVLTGDGATVAGVYGELIDMGHLAVDATVTRGDTVSDGTNTWVLSSAASNRALALKAV